MILQQLATIFYSHGLDPRVMDYPLYMEAFFRTSNPELHMGGNDHRSLDGKRDDRL